MPLPLTLVPKNTKNLELVFFHSLSCKNLLNIYCSPLFYIYVIIYDNFFQYILTIFLLSAHLLHSVQTDQISLQLSLCHYIYNILLQYLDLLLYEFRQIHKSIIHHHIHHHLHSIVDIRLIV